MNDLLAKRIAELERENSKLRTALWRAHAMTLQILLDQMTPAEHAAFLQSDEAKQLLERLKR